MKYMVLSVRTVSQQAEFHDQQKLTAELQYLLKGSTSSQLIVLSQTILTHWTTWSWKLKLYVEESTEKNQVNIL